MIVVSVVFEFGRSLQSSELSPSRSHSRPPSTPQISADVQHDLLSTVPGALLQLKPSARAPCPTREFNYELSALLALAGVDALFQLTVLCIVEL